MNSALGSEVQVVGLTGITLVLVLAVLAPKLRGA